MIAAAVIVIGTLVAMASGRVPPILALGTGLAIAGLLRIVTPEELFAGLSNQGVITVGAMLVIAKGIVSTGVVTRATWMLLSTTHTASQAIRRLMLPIGVASGVMNTTPLVAMLIPATRELEQTRRIPARAVLLPIAHVTTLAGSVTLIGTSSNLLIAGIAGGSGVDMGMLAFAPVALPVALAGWLVIALTAPHLLRGEAATTDASREWRVEIPVSGHALIHGRRASSLGVAATQQYELVAIDRWGVLVEPDAIVHADDVLVFTATEAGVAALWGSPLFGLSPQRLYAATVKSGEGRTLHEFENGSLRVVAARTTRSLHETVLEPGETCYVTSDGIASMRSNESIALWQDAASRVPQPGKTWVALAILVGVIVSASVGLAPIALAAFAGAILMVLTRVLSPGSAGRALDWNVLGILAGSVGLGSIVVSSGLADVLAQGVRTLSAGNVLLVVIVLAVATAIMTNLVTNAAAASILTPVGLGISTELGIDPVVVLALIGTCISFTFINPFSHQSNLMVMRPGGYTTRTFARFGVPLMIGVLASVIVVASLLLMGR
ncbi:MAG: hypothetical protein KF809_10970 [Chloroflexi bacterium]|nr:hypothetical protein [Chloroflexota bacterium]